MTKRGSYAALVDGIFGKGSATFDVTEPASNKVIGALAHPSQFDLFQANFARRLRRLQAAIRADASLEVEILSAVNRVVTSEWDGAYAELSALDYFLAGQDTGPRNVELDRTVPATDTLASEMGMQNANHDLAFTTLGVSMDTKLLSDKAGDILKGIFRDFRSAKGILNLVIIPSYELGSDFTEYSTNRKALLAELISGVDIGVRPRVFSSKVIPGLEYTFGWDAGAHMAASTYSHTEHAASHHRLLFGHAKKFSRREPTLIAFVVFPWSGEAMLTMSRDPQVFFKKFADHFFNDYIDAPEPASTYNGKFRTSMSAGDATKHLSGVVFLEDRSILATDPTRINVDASFVRNANAIHPLAGHPFDAVLRALGARELV